ncbi:large ribosomal subunit protein bL32m [Halyomorpha halys]|uniref:large ribosomal subunit protein bL32m n=1 Tax=Halyomorpha halys TaxID=286706 RepID=UPI0006D4CDC1|nr:39S ribosomal protein L32, mitochondrial [Halyomorpha halys]
MLLNRFICKSREIYFKFESQVLFCFFGTPPPQGFSLDVVNETALNPNKLLPNLENVFQSAFLFAVPKTRRTIEKRRNRKFGFPELHWKPLVPKRNILMCDHCGNDYEAGHLCGYCYKQVKLETEEMQKAIQDELKLNPIDKEVTVVYQGEAIGKPEHFWKGKRVVEMKKPRPAWFSKNLLQKSTVDNSENKNVKPTDLA